VRPPGRGERRAGERGLGHPLRDRRRGLRGGGVRGATVGANIAYGAGYGLLGALISAWPAVAFIGSVEIAMQQVRRARGPHADQDVPTAPAVPGDVEQAVRAAYAASVAAGAPLSQRAMADRFGLSRRKVSQLMAQVIASGNGHLPNDGEG
jgi:hypothetical protein